MNALQPMDWGHAGGRFILLMLLANAAFVSVAAVTGLVLYLPLVLLAASLALVLSRRLVWWLSIIVFGHIVLFLQRTTEISISELVFGIVSYGYLVAYLVDRVAVRNGLLVTAAGDRPLALFFLLAPASIVPAMLFGNDLGLWARELLVLAGLLLYFPLREAFGTRGGRTVVLMTFALLAAVMAVRNIVEYGARLDAIRYAWELVSGRQTAGEPLFMAMVVWSGASLGVASRVRSKAVSLTAFVLFSLSLAATFSRGYWVGTLLALFIVVVLLRKQERMRMMAILSLVVVGGVSVAWLILGDRFGAVAAILMSRLFSAGFALEDVSFLTRLEESRAVLAHIAGNPVMGYGLGAEFAYYNPLRGFTYTNAYVHNAYLWLWYKLGAAGLLVFLALYLAKLKAGLFMIRHLEEHRALGVTAVALLAGMMVISLTSPQFYARDSVLIIALCWAVLASVPRASGVPTE